MNSQKTNLRIHPAAKAGKRKSESTRGKNAFAASGVLSLLFLLLALLGGAGRVSAQDGEISDDSIRQIFREGWELAHDKQAMDSLCESGRKPYERLQWCVKKGRSREALDIFQQHKGDLLMFVGYSDNRTRFLEQIIALYHETLDEEAARDSAIALRSFNDAMMETVIALGGPVPESYLPNKNLLAGDYYLQKDYANALLTLNSMKEFMETACDTASLEYAKTLLNIGSCAKTAFFAYRDATPEEGELLGALISVAEATSREASGLLDALGEHYSKYNVTALFNLLDIYNMLETDSLYIPRAEQLLDIYEKNGWEVSQEVSWEQVRLLMWYLQLGEEEKARALYAKMQAESDKPLPPLEEVKKRLSEPAR